MEAFWTKVKKTKKCWLWTANKNKAGYGKIKIKQKTRLAHRVSWEIHFGPIQDGLFVCHHCDNPTCIKPDHLFLGTSLDNMRDKIKKGRATNLTGAAVSNPGEKNPAAKLTIKQVDEIRNNYKNEDISQSSLAKYFGVSQTMISNIVRRQNWK